MPDDSQYLLRAAGWDLEQDYEQRPRKKRKQDREDTRLPIKNAEGRLQKSLLPSYDETRVQSEPTESLGEEDAENESLELQRQDQPVDTAESDVVSSSQQVVDAKEELAKIAELLTEDPEENVSYQLPTFPTYIDLLTSFFNQASLFHAMARIAASENPTVRKLALATQLAVYKDVIPGYRIRPMAEEEAKMKLSKEVKRLRSFEQALVAGYQEYVRQLGKLCRRDEQSAGSGPLILRAAAISCACALLKAVPHFNFRGELLKILVDDVGSKRSHQDSSQSLEALRNLFETDEDGAPSLEAVSMLAKMMKAKGYRVEEGVLDTFLHLRLLGEFSSKGSHSRIDRSEESTGFRGKEGKPKKEFRAKKQRKLEKERKVVSNEMREADAAVSHEERDRMQAETLKVVFLTYFRILKARTPNLMGAVLEGLAKYAHLINQDFFGDILEALKDLIREADTTKAVDISTESESGDQDTSIWTTRQGLLCVITAFALLQGQDARSAAGAMHLDLNYFTSRLYRALYELSLDPNIERSARSLHLPDPSSTALAPVPKTTVNVQTTVVLLLRCLSAVLLPPQGVRSVPPLRVAAFSKQLLTASLHLPEKSCLATIRLMGKVATVHGQKIAGLWRTEETRGDGIFDGTKAEIEGSNPFASIIWEGEMLKRHYCPAVREALIDVEKAISNVK
ncbi:MAG: hypothetical protein M1817_001291 [Caeruleum heppii]|nr:MAG: hypothetical protein M1817_001291 [Caeruleum heppii]